MKRSFRHFYYISL